MKKKWVRKDCDYCGSAIGENGWSNADRGFCENHMHLKKMPQKVQISSGKPEKNHLGFGACLHPEIPNNFPKISSHLDHFDQFGTL